MMGVLGPHVAKAYSCRQCLVASFVVRLLAASQLHHHSQLFAI